VNHTFTSHLALSASLQPYAGLAKHRIAEYPFAPKPLSRDIMATQLRRDRNGDIAAPDAPGLGVEVDLSGVRKYLVDLEIRVNQQTIYATPALS
jgi:L-alanine-DL-glutamate epimerase-like enolase superfamily enzyme